MSSTMIMGRRKKNKFSLVKFCRNLLAATNEDAAAKPTATAPSSSSPIQMTSLPPPHTESAATSSRASSETNLAADDWFTAVTHNDLRAVSYFLSHGADVNARCPVSGWCALHICAWNGYVEQTELLLDRGQCDVDQPGPGSVTPVFLAAQQRHSVVLELLVGAGCDVTKRATLSMRGGGGGGHVASDVSALHVAAQAGDAEVVRRLLAAGAPVDATMTAGQLASVTPLHVAVQAGHSDVIGVLIQAGCDVNGRTAPASTRPPTVNSLTCTTV